MNFAPVALTDAELSLRDEVRQWLSASLPADFRPGLGIGAGHDPAFSKMLAEQGWVGMAIPTRYGGHGKSAVERFIVTEELLAAGAPVLAHFVADRQTAPTILRYGTEAQRSEFLPRIASGQCYFSIGLSEPDSGSDLASVRTRAERTQGGWLLNGTKVWTSCAHLNDYFVVLCRTSGSHGDRHAGLSQLIVDLRSDGIEISPLPFLDGEHRFNVVTLSDVFVPDDLVLGELGDGWRQVTSELAYERSGPERFLSTYGLFKSWVSDYLHGQLDASQAQAIGRIVARFRVTRMMSLSIAKTIDLGGAPAVEASVVKDIGTRFEQDLVLLIQSMTELELDPARGSMFELLLSESILSGPSFTIRGGTTQVLQSIIAKSLTKAA